MMSKLSSPELTCCNPVPAASCQNSRKYSSTLAGDKQPCGCLHILMDMMTGLANDRSFTLSPAEKYSYEGIQYSDATGIHFSSSSKTITATKDKPVFLVS